MTQQSAVLHDPAYRAVLNAGFVGVVDHMGSDQAVVQAARVSYGAGTKAVSQDRGLIRYLMRHEHLSPFEMCEVKLHLRLPIFVMRQLVRHRSASLNEESARYSEMSDEFYRPELDAIQPQSRDNKQGRDGSMSERNKEGVLLAMEAAHDHSLSAYHTLLGERSRRVDEWYDPYMVDGPVNAWFTEEFAGVAREMARGVMPLNSYTELYWKQNLRNLLHLIRLRADPHAQYETRAYATAIYALVQPLFALCCEAFEDYVRGALTLSRMETALVAELLRANASPAEHLRALVEGAGGAKPFAAAWGLSGREFGEFCQRFGFMV